MLVKRLSIQKNKSFSSLVGTRTTTAKDKEHKKSRRWILDKIDHSMTGMQISMLTRIDWYYIT